MTMSIGIWEQERFLDAALLDALPLFASPHILEERTRPGLSWVGAYGFPDVWYAAEKRAEFEHQAFLDALDRIASWSTESYSQARASLGMERVQRFPPSFEDIIDWPTADYQGRM